MTYLTKIFKKNKFNSKQIEAIKKWAILMKETTCIIGGADTGTECKGFDNCLDLIIRSCKESEGVSKDE